MVLEEKSLMFYQHCKDQVNPPQSKLSKNVCKDKDYMVSVQVVRSKKKPVIDFNTWSLDMVSNLVSDISNTQVKLISEIMLQTACRPSEARALNRIVLSSI